MGKLLAVCTLLAGLLVTGLVGHEAVRRDQEQLAGATQERVTLLAAQVRQRLVAYELALRGGASLFAATTHPTRVQWAAYVDALALDDAYPGVQGVAFATWLPRQRIGDLEWAMHDEGFPDFRVWPRHDGEASSAIVYIEPLDQRNRRALGFDMYSEKIRSEAMAASRDLGTPALTGPVALVQDQGIELQPKPAVLLFVPVYRRGLVPATLDARREALLGWVYAPFRPSDMMAPLVTDPSPLRGIRLFEESSAGERRELYRDDWSPPAGARPVAPVRASIEFLGRRWILEAEPGERLLTEGDSRRPEALLAIGTLMSLMIFAVIWSMSATRDRAHEIARSMTLALRTANEELDQRVAQRTGELVAVNHSLREQVAERELAERALAEALDKEARRNAQLRALADAGISIAALPDDEARFAYLAGQACRLTGCARAVLIPADGPTVAFAPDGIDDGEREWLLASSRHWPRSEQPGQVILPDAALDACGGRPLPDVSAVPVGRPAPRRRTCSTWSTIRPTRPMSKASPSCRSWRR
jgi:CHASE1-domain containing sensor protein